MANLQVTICVRVKQGEKRRWVVTNGKTDPAGPLYLRWYAASSAKYERAGNSFDEAELAQMRLERKLKAASIGAVIPDEAPVPKSHRCAAVLIAYLAFLRTTTKRNGRRYNERAIKAREASVQEFLKLTGKLYVGQITRTDLLRYKEYLYSQGRADRKSQTIQYVYAVLNRLTQKNYPPIGQLIAHKIHTPPLIRSHGHRDRHGPLPPCELSSLLGSYDQLFLPVQPVDALGIHMPSLAPQQHRQPPILVHFESPYFAL